MNAVIFVYHGVGADYGYRPRTLDDFKADLDAVAEAGCAVVSFMDLVRTRETDASLPRPSVVLSFDDGLHSQLDFAVPELERRGLRGSFAVPTSPDIEWLTNRLSFDEVAELAARGHEVVGHSHRHVNVIHQTYAQVLDDLAEMCAAFAMHRIPYAPVYVLPQGYNKHEARMAARARGFKAIRTTRAGVVFPSTDLMDLPGYEVAVDARKILSNLEKRP